MYREVRMVEITEVLRLWQDGVPKKRIAAASGSIPKRFGGTSRSPKAPDCVSATAS
jgi:hypothetical protein